MVLVRSCVTEMGFGRTYDETKPKIEIVCWRRRRRTRSVGYKTKYINISAISKTLQLLSSFLPSLQCGYGNKTEHTNRQKRMNS